MKTKIIVLITFLYAITGFSQYLPTGYKYVYQEEFNSVGTWPTGNTSLRSLDVSGGKYYFQHKKKDKGYTLYTRSINLDHSKDFELITSIQKISGVKDYGICFLFDYLDTDNFQEFAYTANGYYRVASSTGGTWKAKKGWTKNDKIKTGNYATNVLKVRKTGSRVYFYMNSNLLYNTSYESFKGKKMAIRLWRNQKVAINYIRASERKSTTTNNNSTTSKTIMFEDFNNNDNNWATTFNNDADVYVANGNLTINHKRTSLAWAPTIYKYINTTKDFSILARFKKVDGIQNNGYGIIFGQKDKSNRNRFLITGTGYYLISKKENNNRTYLRNWTKLSAIKKGNGQFNTLKVVKSNGTLKYYINSTLVYTNYSPKFYGNRIGFFVNERQRIDVAYLELKYINQGSNNNNSYTNNTTGKSILFEGFNNNDNKWTSSSNSSADVYVSNGNLTINHKRTSGGWAPTIYKYLNSSRDFRIEAQFKKISGVQNNGFGLVFGRKDNDNENKFFITANGSYIINYAENGQRTYLKNWTKSSAIKTGNYAQNTLRVDKIGNTYKYYINGSLIYTSYSKKYFGNRVGFIVYDQQKVEVDYLIMRYLDDKAETDNIRNYTYSDSGFHFSDQFNSNSNNWSTSNGSKEKVEVSNGKYYIDNKVTSGIFSDNTKYIDANRDFEIETKIDKISGVTNYGYGLIFGKGSSGEFRFYIASTGWYKVARVVDDKEQIMQKWIKSSYVKTGNGKSNVLKVKKDNGYYKFYVNGNYLYQTEHEPFYGDKLGFYVANKQKIGVDYIRVKYNSSSNNNYTNNKVLKLPLQENFYSNNNGWYTGDFDTYSTKLNGGRLTIDRKKKGGIFVSRDVDIDTQKDFVIETSISTPLSDASGLYGITFGRKNSSNEYSFLISTNGSYLYRKFDNDKYTKIIPFTSNDAIRTSAGATNKIKIEKHGSLIRFYINGQYMNEAPFQPFFGNKFGYTVYFKQKIVVDNLNIKYETKSSYNDPPVVVITEPTVELKRGFKIVEAKRITVRGKATDSDGIFEIMVNGVEANVSEDGSFVASVPLKYGKNDLVVKATDIKQATSTKTFTIKRKSPEIDEVIVENKKETKIDIGFGKYHALIIGVSEYDDDSVVDLSGEPTKDAQALADVLTSMYGFDKANVKVLKDATRREILRSFIDLRKKVTKNDNLLIFYAGHGNYDKLSERGYWMPSDVDMEYEDNILLNTRLVSEIKSINSKHTLLIADACFSGSIFKSRSYTKEEKSAQRKYSLTSRKAITSGTLKTVPNKSVFIQYLLKKLKQNENKYLPTSKLFSMIEEPVLNNSENIPQRGVIHGTGDEGGDFIFIKQ